MPHHLPVLHNQDDVLVNGRLYLPYLEGLEPSFSSQPACWSSACYSGDNPPTKVWTAHLEAQQGQGLLRRVCSKTAIARYPAGPEQRQREFSIMAGAGHWHGWQSSSCTQGVTCPNPLNVRGARCYLNPKAVQSNECNRFRSESWTHWCVAGRIRLSKFQVQFRDFKFSPGQEPLGGLEVTWPPSGKWVLNFKFYIVIEDYSRLDPPDTSGNKFGRIATWRQVAPLKKSNEMVS